MNRVLILGAGFSHAVSPEMPMTAGLGKRILSRLRDERVEVPAGAFTGPRFEAWLSRLAEPQPDLDAAVNLENRALFMRVSNALREVLVDCETRILGGGGPHWWLQRLIGTLHFANTTVVTFNYDMLLERTIEATWLGDAANHRVSASDLVRHLPPVSSYPTGGIVYPSQPAETFRYLKLHGSVDSFWVTGDESGATIGRFDSGSRWGSPVADSPELRAQVLPGRDPFIVPPAAAKSAFYANPLSRELWHTAAQALHRADEVALVGYSIPLTDLVTSGMLADTVGSTGAKLTVVNPKPDGVVANLEALGIGSDRIRRVLGDDERTAVEVYADELEAALELPLVASNAPDGAALALGRGPAPERFVTGIGDVTQDTAVLEVQESNFQVTGVSLETERQQTLGALRALCPGLRHLRVRYPDGNMAYIGRVDPFPDATGGFGLPADAQCLLLRPTAEPWEPPRH